MEVSMDTNPGLSPLPQQPFSTPPAGSRKRSIQDIDAETPSGGRKSLRIHDKENQENTDPCIPTSTSASKIGSNEGTATQDVAHGDTSNTGPNSSSTMDNLLTDQPSTPVATTPAAKKRKFSPASKEAKQTEKEAKERQKLEEKAKKEEEKRIKEEEKAKKEEEKRIKEEEKKKRDAERDEEKRKREAEREEERKRREEKKKVKDEEKAAKEEEKRKKEEEKSKKERAQTKLNVFFAKPKSTAQSSNASCTSSPKKPIDNSASLNETPQESVPVLSDYRQAFPEFFLKSHTTVAPPHRFERDSDALQHMRERVDVGLKAGNCGSAEPLKFRPSELFRIMPYKRRRGRQPASVKEILLAIQNLDDQSDVSATTESLRNPHDLLKQVSMKSLKFGEDVRPPYRGTYTKNLPESSAHKLMRNPFCRGLPDTNYDYDSEAEWEELEEGEDLDSEEEDDGSEDGDDDMEGFLDDDDDNLVDGKRRLIVGDQEPVCTGIRWQGHCVDPELAMYKIETISDSVTFPINPFSTAYWEKPKGVEQAQTGGPGRSTLQTFIVIPPANPSQAGAPTSGRGPLPVLTAGKAKRPFPPEQLAEFKQAVEGSDLTKTGLIEILKKRFPKVSKDALKDTLNNVAMRVGQKEVDKKWVCK